MTNRILQNAANALASSIVLVCRLRADDAQVATRGEFLRALRAELPAALRRLQQGNIAPVDFAQAAIGPGMAVFSRYEKVLDADGSPMRVRAALAQINQQLGEILHEMDVDLDEPTRFALDWFAQHGHEAGRSGDADNMARGKNTSADALSQEGFAEHGAGKFRLKPREELDPTWNPATDHRVTVWEACQYLIRAHAELGETGAAQLLRRIPGLGETARDLAYRLFQVCTEKGWPQEALAYNQLVVAWPEITRLSREAPRPEENRLL